MARWLTQPQGGAAAQDSRVQRGGGGGGARRGSKKALALHPLAQYERIAAQAADVRRGKQVAVPARYVVSYFVHAGYPLHGSVATPPEECLVVLHVEQHVSDTGVNRWLGWGPSGGGER